MSLDIAAASLAGDIAEAHRQLGTTAPDDLNDPTDLLAEADRLRRALRERMKPISEELERLALTRSAVSSYIRSDSSRSGTASTASRS